MYEKLNYLTSQVYPDYSPTTSIMRAPIIKLTIGDYLYRTPGVLESINITIEDNSSWEIVAIEGEKNVAQLPHYLNVSISFKPIMDILPRRAQELSDTPGLIANGNTFSTERLTQAALRDQINSARSFFESQFEAQQNTTTTGDQQDNIDMNYYPGQDYSFPDYMKFNNG